MQKEIKWRQEYQQKMFPNLRGGQLLASRSDNLEELDEFFEMHS